MPQCLLLTQSGHLVLRIVATQNDGRTPFRRRQSLSDWALDIERDATHRCIAAANEARESRGGHRHSLERGKSRLLRGQVRRRYPPRKQPSASSASQLSIKYGGEFCDQHHIRLT